MPDYRSDSLEAVEAQRERTAEPELEADLSVNDWIQRVQGAVMSARSACRFGASSQEWQHWIEAAAICVGRAEQVLRLSESSGEKQD